ncbi:hypothetical protein QYE76_000735 [Lolium multiflorum]|uniref:Ubiquitin-like domain-containing protein n=1 Tax=Lolium multiflorum TaxID=4521 RepID=A0AAD8RJB4_LOLMU|nr:hypothetical protein QYE76_000735 [Lolium multiflorum]
MESESDSDARSMVALYIHGSPEQLRPTNPTLSIPTSRFSEAKRRAHANPPPSNRSIDRRTVPCRTSSSDFKMIIHVKKMCLPLSRALEVESTDTVGSVKEKLGNIVGEGPPQLMLLILANKLLDNDRTLASYNIQDGSSIYLKHNLFSKKDPTEIFRV